MPPKKSTSAVLAKGTIMHMFANQPKPKPKPKPVAPAEIPREFMTLGERDDADREEREASAKLRSGNTGIGGQMDGGDDMDVDTPGRRSPRKHDTPEPQAKVQVKSARRSLSGKLKSAGKLKEDVKMSVEQVEEEEIAVERRSPRKHASTPVPELRPPRAVSGSVRRTLGADDDTDEAPQSDRRSPRKHAGTPVPGSRAGTPGMNQKDSTTSLKRTASALSNHPTKTRRTISPSPDRRVRLSATPTNEPQTPPRPTAATERKTPIVEISAYNANWHAAMSPRKKVVETVDSTSTTPKRQATSMTTSNGTTSTKANTGAQAGTTAGKVMKRTTRSNSAALELPGRGKRSRTGTPSRITPPKTKAKESSSFLSTLAEAPSPPKKTPTPKQKSSSFLTPLEDTPSPPSNFVTTKPVTANSSFATNGKSSQSRTVVEDTDAESSDSEDSLVDMVSLIRNASRPSNSLPSPKKSAARARLPAVSRPQEPNRYKFTLKDMVVQMADSEKTDESAKRVQKMMEDQERASANPSISVSGTVTPHDGHARLLEEAVKSKAEDGGKDAHKILKAVKRAAPIEGTEMVYHFFTTGKEKKTHKARDFPGEFLEKEGPKATWHKLFAERENREVAMQDNFFAEMVAAEGKMSDEMFLWILEEIAEEQDEMLRHRYVEMLLSAPGTMRELLTPETVRAHFRLLGARKEAVLLDNKMELEPMQETQYPGRTMGDHWGELESFLRLLGNGVSMISSKTREYALGVILRLCADKLVRTHITLQEAVQLALFKLSEAFAEEEWKEVSTRISNNLYTALPTPHLLLHIFSSIPSRPRLHNLRRRLAYAYFLHDPSILNHHIQEIFNIPTLSHELESARFLPSRDTPDREYSLLDASIQLLDIALDSGSSSTAPKLGQRHLHAHLASLGSPPPRPKLKAEEVEKEERFNEEIDTLNYRLKVILNRIQDLGPGHAERSNTRTTLQSLGQRIEMTIRTKIKPRDSNFVMPEQVRLRRIEREQERGKNFLKKFLRKPAQEKKALSGADEVEEESEVEEDALDAQAEAQLLLARFTEKLRSVN